MKATNKVKAVPAALKKAGIAHPTTPQMVSFCVACFSDVMSASATLENAKALWDAARVSLRIELARAYKVIAHGKAWDSFKADLRAALVNARVCETLKDAGRLVNNALIALSITGNGAKKGGKKGRKEKVAGTERNVTTEAPSIIVAALAYISKAQEKHAGDGEVTEMLGEIAAILGAGK
jgi:hypothetical protein